MDVDAEPFASGPIPWHEPIAVRLFEDPVTHYACRLCIAERGLKGSDIPGLPTDKAVVREHLALVHGVGIELQ